MTREYKCKLAIERGFTYDPESGNITGPKGKEILSKKNNYIRFKIYFNGKYYHLKAHQFAWYWINKECVEQIDHINGIKDDNRICNLRAVTNQQNTFNTKSKGYHWDKNNNKWQAQIGINRKQIYLGRFEKEEDARAAYLEAKEKYHII
jgi:hypothetical protein